MKRTISLIVLTTISYMSHADSGQIVHIEETPNCNYIVTNQSVPPGGEIRLRAAADGIPVGFISIGKYLDQVKAIQGGKVIPVSNITTNEVFKLPITDGGKYALFLTKDGMTCANNVKVTSMVDFDRVSLGDYPVDIKIYVPEF
jgi:hypothetical protein